MAGDVFADLKRFLTRKFPLMKLEWETRPAIMQMLSPVLTAADASTHLSKFKEVVGAKMGADFEKAVFTVNVQSRGTRLILSVSKFMEFFGDEINTDWSGGGKGLRQPITPVSTTMRR